MDNSYNLESTNLELVFVLATGEMHSVKEFVTLSFEEVGIKIKWEGTGVNEKGINPSTNEILVEVDEKYFRPTEVELLLGDPRKAQKELGWKHKYNFTQLVQEMVQADLELFKKDQYLKEGGHKTLNQHE